MTDTPAQYIGKKFPQLKEQEVHSTSRFFFEKKQVRNKLGMFNLKGHLHNQPISLLSGGQKNRVVLTEIGLRNVSKKKAVTILTFFFFLH